MDRYCCRYCFFVGPFIQEISTGFFRRSLVVDEVKVYGCSPLQSSTLIISSERDGETKTHSANQFPFMQQARIALINKTNTPITDSAMFIAPLNSSNNYLIQANFYTDNNVSAKDFVVEELPKNSSRVELGTFAASQVLVLEFVTLYPTAFVVEFSGSTESTKQVIDAGSCEFSNVPDKLTLPVDFFAKLFPEPESDGSHANFKVDDIVDSIGSLNWELLLRYDCGSGIEEQRVPLGSSVKYCHMQISGS